MKSQFTRRNNIMSFNNSILKIVCQILPCLLSVLCIEKCPENAIHPNVSELQTQLNDWRWENEYDAAIFIHPRFLPEDYTANIENTDTGLEHNGSMIMALSRDRACPPSIRQLTSRRRRLDRQTASCPFYYELDFNPDRFPETMVTARCKCAQCVGTSAKTSVKVSSKCEAVSIYQKVLRRYVDNSKNKGCDDKGVYKYRNSFQKVNVGCMCVYNRTKKAGKPGNPKTGAT